MLEILGWVILGLMIPLILLTIGWLIYEIKEFIKYYRKNRKEVKKYND